MNFSGSNFVSESESSDISGLYLTSSQRNYLERQLSQDLSKSLCQRLKIMLLADDGLSQAEICRQVLCSSSTARHWAMVVRSGQLEQWKENNVGRPKCINESYLNRLRFLVESSPKEHGYPFHRWTSSWLSQHLAKELGITLSARHVSRLLKQMGLSTRQSTAKVTHQDGGKAHSNIVIGNLYDAPMPLSSSASSTPIWLGDLAEAEYCSDGGKKKRDQGKHISGGFRNNVWASFSTQCYSKLFRSMQSLTA